ncbi:DUF2897 family protein [Shewanella sp. A14]
MSLEGYEVWLIIILVIGVIASNIAVLKYSAKFKMPQFGEPKEKKPHSGQQSQSEKTVEASPAEDNKNTKDNNPPL